MDVAGEPKISIIVPVYKVEPYIRKCLDSIAAQTYRNLEVILVDDGSPDNCPAICDEYAAKDTRFRVIHKKNGGISSAYNAGLDACTGDWIGFVDSDDWVEPDMFEYLLAGAQRNNVKMAACGFHHTDGRREKAHAFERERVISGRQAVETVINESAPLLIAVWQKLYARELWNSDRFPEDPDAVPDFLPSLAVLLRTQALACLPEAKYWYLTHEGNWTSDQSLRRALGAYLTWEELYSGMLAQEPELQSKAINRWLIDTTLIWRRYYFAPRDERKAAMPKIREISAFCRPHIGQVVRDPGTGFMKRIECWLLAWPTWWSFALAYALQKLSDWKHGESL